MDESIRLMEHFVHLNEDIRAVGMEGATSTGKQDEFSDLDITLFTNDLKRYIENDEWLDFFGERIIMQKPGEIQLQNGAILHPYLMLFKTGQRIDLKLATLDTLASYIKWDSTVQIIIDKDRIMKTPLVPDESSFYVERPSEDDFFYAVNEFFWVVPYVVKGLARKQFLYATTHLEGIREELLKVLAWSIGQKYDYKVNLGNAYKFMHLYLSADDWEKLQLTYNCSSFENMKRALIILIDLMERYAKDLAESCLFEYAEENDAVIQYVKHKIWL